jgi:hypothetical protein
MDDKAKAAEELLLAEREYVKAQAAIRSGGLKSHTVYADALARMREAEKKAWSLCRPELQGMRLKF